MDRENKAASVLQEALHGHTSVPVLGCFGPKEVGKGKNRQHLPMADFSREETQCLDATSDQKVSDDSRVEANR